MLNLTACRGFSWLGQGCDRWFQFWGSTINRLLDEAIAAARRAPDPGRRAAGCVGDWAPDQRPSSSATPPCASDHRKVRAGVRIGGQRKQEWCSVVGDARAKQATGFPHPCQRMPTNLARQGLPQRDPNYGSAEKRPRGAGKKQLGGKLRGKMGSIHGVD